MNDLIERHEIRDVPPEASVTPTPMRHGGGDDENLGTEQRRQRPLPEIVDAATFIAETIQPPNELIRGILHQGSKLAFGGPSKAFKTWSLLDLACSVATGEDWLGFPTVKSKVLFLNLEIQPHALQKRILAVASAKGIQLKSEQIYLLNLRGYAADFRTLIPKIIDRATSDGYALIVLDPIYKVYGGTDENGAGPVAELLNALERMAVETGAAVAYGCHFAKGNASAKEAIDRISGSGVFARDPDSLLLFTQHEQQGAFTVEPILRNFAPIEPFVVLWGYPLMQRAHNLDPAKLKQVVGRKKAHDPKKLLAVIATRDEKNPVSISEWALAGNVKRQTLADYLTGMRDNGWIKTIGKGTAAKQAITNVGKVFLNGGKHDGH